MLFWALIGAIVGSRVAYVIAHLSEFSSPLEWLYVWKGGISLLGGIAGAIVINIRRMHKYGYRFFQVMDPAAVALAMGIGIGRIGDLIIGDHLGKPTSWLLAWTYHGGNLAPPFTCLNGVCQAQLQGGHLEVIQRSGAKLIDASGKVLATGVGVHQTAMYDMILAWILFAILWRLYMKPRREGVVALTFGLYYGLLPAARGLAADRQAVRTVHGQPVDGADGRPDLGGHPDLVGRAVAEPSARWRAGDDDGTPRDDTGGDDAGKTANPNGRSAPPSRRGFLAVVTRCSLDRRGDRIGLALTSLQAARAQMAVALGFHIVFAALAIGVPLLLLFTEYLAIRRDDAVWMAHHAPVGPGARHPRRDRCGLRNGPVVRARTVLAGADGPLGVGDRAPVRARGVRVLHRGDLHRDLPLRLGPAVAVGALVVGLAGGARAARRARGSSSPRTRGCSPRSGSGSPPAGRWSTSQPIRAMLNPSTPVMTTHMILAGYMATGLTIASVYAVGMLKGRRDTYHRRALAVGLTFGLVLAPVQVFVGDLAAKLVAERQPMKLAAMEGLWDTTAARAADDRRHPAARPGGDHAGDPDPEAGCRGWRTGDTDAVVQGLKSVPPADRPNTIVVHLAFQAMVAIGFALLGPRRVGAGGVVAPRPSGVARRPLVPARRGRRGPGRVHRARGGMGRHRGRPSAVDRLRPDAHRGRGDHARGHRVVAGRDGGHVRVAGTRRARGC